MHEHLTCVCLHVFIKILFHIEVFPTPLTHKLLVSDVDAHVRAQLVLILKTLTADLKDKEWTNFKHGQQLIMEIMKQNVLLLDPDWSILC